MYMLFVWMHIGGCDARSDYFDAVSRLSGHFNKNISISLEVAIAMRRRRNRPTFSQTEWDFKNKIHNFVLLWICAHIITHITEVNSLYLMAVIQRQAHTWNAIVATWCQMDGGCARGATEWAAHHSRTIKVFHTIV